jgi:hypothetical protein
MRRSGGRWKSASWMAARSGLAALVVPFPHYDPKKLKVRA